MRSMVGLSVSGGIDRVSRFNHIQEYYYHHLGVGVFWRILQLDRVLSRL